MLKPPNVTPESRIGIVVDPFSRRRAVRVPSRASTVIGDVLSRRKCGPLSQTATSGAYLGLSFVFGWKGPSSIPTHLEDCLVLLEASWCIVEESAYHLVPVE